MNFQEWLKAQGYCTTYNEVRDRCKGIESIAKEVWSGLRDYLEYSIKKNQASIIDEPIKTQENKGN
jgi:hypothetical protein